MSALCFRLHHEIHRPLSLLKTTRPLHNVACRQVTWTSRLRCIGRWTLSRPVVSLEGLGASRQRRFASSSSSHDSDPPTGDRKTLSLRENIYTLPNGLTVSRILSCPLLGYFILHGNFKLATATLVYAGVTDLLDGWIARRYAMKSVLGTILDPAADKILMTTLTVTLAMGGMLPIPLAVIILGRDVLLSISALYIRYTSLTPPKTFSRYWDFSIPSAEVHPTSISKINTFLQLGLMGITTISPLLAFDTSLSLTIMQWTVATTTIWSGLSYVFSPNAVRVLTRVRTKSGPKS